MKSLRGALGAVLGIVAALVSFVLVAAIGLTLVTFAVAASLLAGGIALIANRGKRPGKGCGRTRRERIWNDGRGPIIDM